MLLTELELASWQPQHAIDPRMVREAAGLLGVDLSLADGEYHLLHVVLSYIAAPLPADWQEVMRGGKLVSKKVAVDTCPAPALRNRARPL